MNIVFVTGECVPFASTGGLGEVCGALPAALAAMGHQVTVVMPLYRQVRESSITLMKTDLTASIPVGLRSHRARYKFSERNGVRIYFVERDEFFDRTNLYGPPELDYDDNFERFVFFQKAAVELIDQIDLNADVVHVHDWQTGLVPLFLRYGIDGVGRDGTERTVFTIHNLSYQGNFPASEFAHTNLPYSCFSVEGVEYYGDLSCMKAGIVYADRVTTVSPTYAREIQTRECGRGMDGVLRSRGEQLAGILNGVDYREWNPGTDPAIAKTYNRDTVEAGKEACRSALRKQFGLRNKVGAPVIGMVTRMVAMKGLDLIADIMPKLKGKAQFVLLGSGVEKYERLAEKWAATAPDDVACYLGYNPELAHQVYAGSDLFLMPSQTEPCGLSQLYSMRYGTVPVVHSTGGLADTVIDVDQDPDQGTGFAFTDYQSKAFWKALQRALELHSDPVAWQRLRQRIMDSDFSWHRSAGEYIKLYDGAVQDHSRAAS